MPRKNSNRETKESEEENKKQRISVWLKPRSSKVKLIDFGGATSEDEYHTAVINTRQYRAPEVILGKSLYRNT